MYHISANTDFQYSLELQMQFSEKRRVYVVNVYFANSQQLFLLISSQCKFGKLDYHYTSVVNGSIHKTCAQDTQFYLIIKNKAHF